MPRLLATLLVLTTAALAAAGCGNDSTSSSGAASVAPADSLIYGEATLRPEGEQKAAVEALVNKFPGEGSAGDRIQGLMESLFTEADTSLSYREDVEPWLGDEAAFFVSNLSPDGEDADAALLVATEDEAASLAAVQKAASDERKSEHAGEDVYLYHDGDEAAAAVDGWLALGTPRAVEAAIDTAGGDDPIEDEDRFQETLEDAPEDRLGFVYVDTPGFYERLQEMPGAAQLGPFRQFFEDAILVTADAEESAVRFEATIPTRLTAGFPIVSEGSGEAGDLPADAWAAVAQPDLGGTIEGYVDIAASAIGGRDVIEEQVRAATGLDLEEDVISWMGDWSAFIRGTSVDSLDGAVVVETSDEEASGRFIDAMVRLVRQDADPGVTVGPLDLAGGGEGYTVRGPELAQPVHLFQRDGRVVAAYGDAAANDALDPGETLAGTDDYTQAEDALGGDYAVSFFLALEPILELAENEGASADEDYREAKPYLEPLGALVGGATEDGDDLRSAFALTVK
jgi:Protein of unknown function (DUF3352)